MKLFSLLSLILLSSVFAHAGDDHYSVNCFTSNGDVYLSIPSSDISKAIRYSSEATSYQGFPRK